MSTVRRKLGFGILHLSEMLRTIKEESCFTNPSFISSSNVLKLAAMLVMTLLLSSLINIQTANAQIFLFKFGTFGSGDGQFNNVTGVAVDGIGKIYVCDYNNRIQVFDSSGNFLFKFGTFGTGDGQFEKPYGVAVDSTGKIYVADTFNARIQVFDSSGNFLFKFGTFGTGNGQFQYPFGVAVDSTGKIYVADTINHRIQVFNSSGNFLFKFGTFGTGDGQFTYPPGVAVDGIGKIYVADSPDPFAANNARIEVFDSSGTFLFKFGTFGTGNGQFQIPFGVAVDGIGNIYVVDSTNNRIEVFDSSGTFLFKFGTFGTGNGQFGYPYGVAVDSTGKIYVADSANCRIQVFSAYAAGAPEPYNFIGFYPPVDNPPAVNAVKAGSAVPVKFSVEGYSGTAILLDQEIACDSLDPLGTVEEAVSAGSTGLIYNEGTDRYSYVWKTKKAWSGSCRQFIVKLDDETEHIAYFEFR
jgi:sugar lactone lactonase YvrE